MGNDNYTQCTICHEHFNKNDDIVVCPECGAPSHRSCFKEKGECAFCHGKGGVVFKDPKEVLKPKDDISSRMVTCPNCGELNHPENKNCNKCGHVLQTQEEPLSFGFGTGTTNADMQSVEEAGFEQFVLGGVGKDETIEGIPAKEIAAYVGPNSGYYLNHFKVFSTQKRKYSFSFSAFFFPPLFYLYRKMWGIGIFSIIISITLRLPLFIDLFANAGIQLPFVDALKNLFWVANPQIGSILFYAFASLSGLFANYLYKQKVIKSIKKCKEDHPENYGTLLVRKGGVSRIVSSLALVFLLTAIWFG